MYFYVFCAPVIGGREVYAYGVFLDLVIKFRVLVPKLEGIFDGVEVALKSFKDFAFGLANVLHPAGFARDTVDEIGASASNVGFTGKNLPCDMAVDCALSIQKWAVIACFFCNASVSDVVWCWHCGCRARDSRWKLF